MHVELECSDACDIYTHTHIRSAGDFIGTIILNILPGNYSRNNVILPRYVFLKNPQWRCKIGRFGLESAYQNSDPV